VPKRRNMAILKSEAASQQSTLHAGVGNAQNANITIQGIAQSNT